MENSIRAGADIVAVGLSVAPAADRLDLSVEDNGPGLAVAPAQATDPFYTTKSGKRTGLGLSLFRTAGEQAGGALALDRSALGGLAVHGRMQLRHVDRKPLGDLAASLWTAACTNPAVDVRFRLCAGGAERTVSSRTVAAELGAGGTDALAVAEVFAERVRAALAAAATDGAAWR